MSTVVTTTTYDEFGLVEIERFQEDGSPTPGGSESYYTKARPDLKAPPSEPRQWHDARNFKWVRLG